MKISATTARRGLGGAFAACMLGGVAAATIAVPAASAQPAPCNASSFATTASGVLNAAGGYLNTHPGANDVLTRAATQPAGEAEANVRRYFEAHPNEYLDLRNIARPLIDQRNQCGYNVSPSQLNLLFNELAS
ncbi:heme-binding protein [Mycolicibacterium sp. S2-37]|uniref:heme-binding protein n=1 Tax=Mycolicibacterium sp. S2-37 TaxID=2810297 RepID=UPI001A93D2A1|nr:heme-binding protein [Mycolicibacterium sp. S2-37]MBO0677198.1 heme-binding protein [Mycolicibacterium sp. S2-37]